MKKRIFSLLIVLALMISSVAMSASAVSITSLPIEAADFTVIHPIEGNENNTDPSKVNFQLYSTNNFALNNSYFEVTSINWFDLEDTMKTSFEFVAGKQYAVMITVTCTASNVDFESMPERSQCKINGVQATDVKIIENSNNLKMIAATVLTADKVGDILAFGQVAPKVTAEEERTHITELGDIEYGTYTMFGYDIYPLSQAQKDMGYTVEEKIYVNYGGGTLVTRSSGDPFDIMMYVDQLLTRGSNPFSNKWSVWFTVNLSQNDEYVGSIGHVYNFNIVPALVSYVQLNAPRPVVNSAPDYDLANYSVGGEGYEIVDVDWTDTEGIILPDQAVFEMGESYECVLQVETFNGYTFPENRAELSGKINGIDGVISTVYSTNKAYITVRYTMAKYGDVDLDGKVTAADALEVLKSVVGKVNLTQTQFTAADTDGNGKADAADALNILKKVVGKIDHFPIDIR